MIKMYLKCSSSPSTRVHRWFSILEWIAFRELCVLFQYWVWGIQAPLEASMHYNKSLCCREQRKSKHLFPTCQVDYKVIRFSAALSVVMQTHRNKTQGRKRNLSLKQKLALRRAIYQILLMCISNVIACTLRYTWRLSEMSWTNT